MRLGPECQGEVSLVSVLPLPMSISMSRKEMGERREEGEREGEVERDS